MKQNLEVYFFTVTQSNCFSLIQSLDKKKKNIKLV